MTQQQGKSKPRHCQQARAAYPTYTQSSESGIQMIAQSHERWTEHIPAPESSSLSCARDKTVACQLHSTQSTPAHQQTRKPASMHACWSNPLECRCVCGRCVLASRMR